ncbi:transposase, partial [Staphylococcus aureus]
MVFIKLYEGTQHRKFILLNFTFMCKLGKVSYFFQINQKLSEPETKKIYSQRKIDVEPVFGFMKAILGFTRMSVRGINKVKRELG